MTEHPLAHVPTTTIAEVVGAGQVLDLGVRSLWEPVPHLVGPAFTVACPPGDNLMVHAAIYRAEPGSVIVVESGDTAHALAGGNVCAVAQRHGVAGLVLDGVVRDVGEVRDAGFPVFARGVVPVPGTKQALGTLGRTIRCGGVDVHPGDVVVADEDGVVVVPGADLAATVTAARARLAAEAEQSLDSWEQDHRRRIDQALREVGFEDPHPDG